MRKDRYPPLQSGLTYHLLNQGNNGETIFKEERNYEYFLKKYREYISPIAQTFAYCLLPNHFHFLLKFKNYRELHIAFPNRFPKPPIDLPNREKAASVEHVKYDEMISKSLSRHFANYFGGYARAINKGYGRKGKLFSLPFERILVDNEAYFQWLICYLHRNPVHHGFCAEFGNWRHCSFQEIRDGIRPNIGDHTLNAVGNVGQNPICDLEFLRFWFGSPEKYMEAHDDSMQAMLEKRYRLE